MYQPGELILLLRKNFKLFVILICLQMARAISVLTAVVTTYGWAMSERTPSTNELPSELRMDRKDRCIFAICEPFSINLI